MTEQRKLAMCAIAIVLGVSAYAKAMSYAMEVSPYQYPAHQCRPQRML